MFSLACLKTYCLQMCVTLTHFDIDILGHSSPRLKSHQHCVSFRFDRQVGKAMSSNESAAYEIMRSLDVDYVLIIFGGVIGYSGDDINKFLWMVRIAEGEHPKDIRVRERKRERHVLNAPVASNQTACTFNEDQACTFDIDLDDGKRKVEHTGHSYLV